MDNLKNIIEDLKVIRTKTKTKVSDEILFEQAVDIYISQEIGKQKNMQGNKQPFLPPNKNVSYSLATEKQKDERGKRKDG